ncbi:hypothetical protein RFN30_24915 [Mesorhizobium sp. VK23D]|nr:hypothetical protein [Mesorhizobium sp. VK23D]
MGIDEMMRDIATIREIGLVDAIGRLIEEARGHPDAERAAGEIADHEVWFKWATEHERTHGRDSLLDTQHPIYLEAEEMARSVRYVGIAGGGYPIAD